MYTPDLAGLMECYVSGLPDLARSLLGDLAYGAILFGGFAVVRRLGHGADQRVA